MSCSPYKEKIQQIGTKILYISSEPKYVKVQLLSGLSQVVDRMAPSFEDGTWLHVLDGSLNAMSHNIVVDDNWKVRAQNV